ncbi:hypothetical protein CsSME_00034155 [Camellia sinensis var. sinensis]
MPTQLDLTRKFTQFYPQAGYEELSLSLSLSL